jgi:hypothetical protein
MEQNEEDSECRTQRDLLVSPTLSFASQGDSRLAANDDATRRFDGPP